MGSSSVLVLIGSDSHCNSFVVNQFLFFHTKWRKFVIHPRSNESKVVDFLIFLYFLLAKYIPMACNNGGQKREWWHPTACVGSYFIPDENIQTYLICLQSCNMQKYQEVNFRTAEYVCVQQRWLKVGITHVSWHVTSWNTCSLLTCTRSTMWTRENIAAINNKAW